jgi:F0F1-type ATP synthase alpha subunit
MSTDNRHYEQLVAKGKPIGEVIAVDRFLIKVKGLHPVNVHALVMFEDGTKGLVHHVFEDYVVVLHL